MSISDLNALQARFPRLPICLLLDGLYAGGPTFQVCSDYNWKYLVVPREDDLPQPHRSFAAVIPHLPDQQKRVRLQDVNLQNGPTGCASLSLGRRAALHR
jgi:hypothetical protein